MDYKKAYLKLFNAITTAINQETLTVELLKKVQQETEENYIENKNNLLVIKTHDDDKEN